MRVVNHASIDSSLAREARTLTRLEVHHSWRLRPLSGGTTGCPADSQVPFQPWIWSPRWIAEGFVVPQRGVGGSADSGFEGHFGGSCYAQENPGCVYCQQCGADMTVTQLGGVIGNLRNRNAFWWAAATAALSAAVASAIVGWPV